MSNRYWVGGTGNWSDDDNHWASSSGGSPANGNLPTSSDDVFIDANSGFGGGGTISLGNMSDIYCHDLICTSGHSYNLSAGSGFSDINIYGSVVLESGITFVNNAVLLMKSDTNESFTSNGCVVGDIYVGEYGDASFPTVTFQDATSGEDLFIYGGSATLGADLTLSGSFYQENGTFDANNHNVTANDFYFYADTGYTPTVIMGSGTWEATGYGVDSWFIDEYNGEVVTVTPETSTIKITGGGEIGFQGGGKTYNNFWAVLCSLNVLGSNTFADFKVGAGSNIYFEKLKTQTTATFTVVGTSSDHILIDSYGVGQHTLSKSSGTVSCDYLDISNSNVTGGATWYAGSHSADTTNNDGWLFEDAPSLGCFGFIISGFIPFLK